MNFSLYGTPYCANMLTFAFVRCKTHPWEDITALPSSQRFCQIQSVLLGLGLCRMSAAGNKTIAMNCLRIMLGINPPRPHTQPNDLFQWKSNPRNWFLVLISESGYISWSIGFSISWSGVLCECRGVMCASDVRRITCYHSPATSLPHRLRQTNNSKANHSLHKNVKIGWFLGFGFAGTIWFWRVLCVASRAGSYASSFSFSKNLSTWCGHRRRVAMRLWWKLKNSF